jgi:hypothetical protein
MPATTPVFHLPYPLPTDQVSAGAGDIRGLAEAIEPILAGNVDAPGTAARWMLQTGADGVPLAAGETLALPVAVYAPAFAATPNVVFGLAPFNDAGGNTSPQYAPVVGWIYTQSAAQHQLMIRNTSNGALGLVGVYWIAFGPKVGALSRPAPEGE